ncbi:MAG: acyl carrier protein [Candidatus Zixiibacteriota bacterium]
MIREKVLRIVGQVLEVDPASLTDESSGKTIEAWDSLKHINLILSLEEEFDVHLNDEQILKMNSVGSIVSILKEVSH